ncbi:MAG: ABC transporter permease [Candidatus Thiodiazotropha sp.]
MADLTRRWLPLMPILVWALAALSADIVTEQAGRIQLQHILDPPGVETLLGYDDLGRSVLSRLWSGARISFVVALGVVTLSLLVGTVLGLVAGYRGGWLDLVLMRIVDVFLAFPGILLAIALAGVMGPGIDNLIIALSAVGWVGYARLARGQVLALKQREHVTAARALGTPGWRILGWHILPMLAAPLIVEATFGLAGTVIAEAGLSYLGLGVQPPQASWGSMIRDGAGYMLMAPHMVLAPGIAIMLVVLSLNLIGDRLRDWLDHRI